MAIAQRASYRFAVKRSESDEHVIGIEPVDRALPALSHCEGQLTFVLKPGLTIYEARALARLLNERIEGLGTKPFAGAKP
jgi:hypothetical protein